MLVSAFPSVAGITHKKLSYRRGTARRAMLVNECYVSRSIRVGNVSNRKMTFEVIGNGAI